MTRKGPNTARRTSSGWTIMPGAANVVDLSYPIKPTGMSLIPVYPPLVIKDEVPLKGGMKRLPRDIDPETGYPAAGFYARTIFQMSEGHGTHAEASSHGFGERGRNIDEYPLSRYIAPLVVIDLAGRTQTDPDRDVTVEDLEEWEKRNGRIPEQAAVVLYSGRGRYWGDNRAYLGKDENGVDHYPGFSLEAARFLVSPRCRISMLGTDLPVVDGPALRAGCTSSRPFATAPVRDIVQGPPNDVIILEYLANLHLVPEAGALIIAAPINFVGGAQGTARVLAVLPVRAKRGRAQVAG